jgi:hypothetical protein
MASVKLGIVIPLKSKRVSRDWEAVSHCLEATLRSLGNQSSDDWVAVVVGHEKPEIRWDEVSERVTWVEFTKDLPPLREGGSFTKHTDFDYILDKNRKTAAGMLHLQSQAITYWFVLDADDFVHRDFVHTLVNLPKQAGWLLKSGYLWYQDLRRWMPTQQMLNLCGSTAVIGAELFEVPTSGRDEDLQKIPWCRMSHSDMEEFLMPHMAGADATFPIAAIAYTLSHGDNCSDEFRVSFKARLRQWIKKRISTHPLRAEFAEAFGMRFESRTGE